MQSKYGIAAIAVLLAAQSNQPVQALRLQQQLDQLSQEQNALNTENQAEWGFLKNIVNIDRFFASGDEASPSKAENVQVSEHAKIKSQAHLLAQMKSKSKDSETGEEEIAATQTDQEEGNTEIAKTEAVEPNAEKQQENMTDVQERQQKAAEEKEIKEQAKPENVQVDEKKGSTVTVTTTTQSHAEQVRNEGLSIKHSPNEDKQEVDLEIDEENAAAAADEGSQTMKDKAEFSKLQTQLKTARAKPENKIGEGGFLIELEDPSEFKGKINLVVVPNPQDLEKITVEKFDTEDQKQASTAAQALQIVLASEAGATIVSDDTPGKESIVKNTNSMYNSEISAGITIQKNLVQKMAPGDHKYHTVNYQPNNEQNGYRSFATREEGQKHYEELADSMPRLLISGETGDVLMAHGTKQEIDQCLGNFFTQRYKGKYYGQN